MRLAVLSDIHGSLPALEAVLHDLQQFNVEGMIVAGDMVAGPNSVETIHRLRDLGCWMIRGNNENYLLRFDSGEAPTWWHTSHQWAFMRWTYNHLDKETLELIRSMTEQRVITLPETDPIRVVHGSPRNPDEHLFPGYGPVPLDTALEQTIEPVFICGHTHIPWQVRKNGRLAFNPGAVCGPLDGSTDAQYALLDWQDGHWELEHRSVPYDFELVRLAYQESGLLEEGGAFARLVLLSIQTSRNLLMQFLPYAYRLAAEAGYSDSEYVPDDIWDQAAETFDWEKPSQTKRRIS